MPPATQEKKITLNLKQVVTPPPAPKPQPVVIPPKPVPVVTPPVQPQPVIEKKPEPKPEETPVKQKMLDERKKSFALKSTEENNITKIKPKPKPKPKPKKKIVKKKVKEKPVKKTIKKKKIVKKTTKPKRVKRSKDPLANMLMGSGTPMQPKRSILSSNAGAYGEQMIKKLYGPEFNTYSPTQKKFIRNNLSTIHRITQNTLTRNGYPPIAIRTRQQGTNVVSFYLHPNGDISQLRLKTPIGYAALDQNTIDVIRIAYKDYPLPNKKTRIVFYVTYRLY